MIPPRRTRRFPEGVDVDPADADARALGYYVLADARCVVCGAHWPVAVTRPPRHCGEPVAVDWGR